MAPNMIADIMISGRMRIASAALLGNARQWCDATAIIASQYEVEHCAFRNLPGQEAVHFIAKVAKKKCDCRFAGTWLEVEIRKMIVSCHFRAAEVAEKLPRWKREDQNECCDFARELLPPRFCPRDQRPEQRRAHIDEGVVFGQARECRGDPEDDARFYGRAVEEVVERDLHEKRGQHVGADFVRHQDRRHREAAEGCD